MNLIKTARGRITTFHGEDAGRANPHIGIDIGHGDQTAADLALVAPAAGLVRAAGWDGTYGNRVIIDHPDGTWSLVAHMAAFYVSVGKQVAQAQGIGLMGRTGGPWGSVAGWFVHAHQEYHLADGSAVDPLAYIVETAAPITLEELKLPTVISAPRGTRALITELGARVYTRPDDYSLSVNVAAYGDTPVPDENAVTTLVREANDRGDQFAEKVAEKLAAKLR